MKLLNFLLAVSLVTVIAPSSSYAVKRACSATCVAKFAPGYCLYDINTTYATYAADIVEAKKKIFRDCYNDAHAESNSNCSPSISNITCGPPIEDEKKPVIEKSVSDAEITKLKKQVASLKQRLNECELQRSSVNPTEFKELKQTVDSLIKSKQSTTVNPSK